ncbi:MAG: 2,3-diaminopropionate biosynthesis protein SbnB [Acidobacteria bacterium]|nr:2,3-diaminopropionate biosynthesis protein SbnB [Acidobacteriota bacterium]
MPGSNRLLWLNDETVADLLSPEEAAVAVGRALELHSKGLFQQPLKPYIRPGGREDEFNRGRFIFMPSYLGGDFESAGIKIIAGFPCNVDRGLPRASGVFVLNSTETGFPLAVMECGELSARRTAATAALAFQHLASSDSNQLVSVFGAGPIAVAVLRALVEAPRVAGFKLYDPRRQRAEDLAERLTKETGASIDVVDTAASCLSECRAVVLATTGSKAYVTPDMLSRDNSLIVALSLDDVTPEVFLSADKVVVDCFEDCCREEKLLHRLVTEGRFSREQVWAEIGEIISGRKVGRQSDDEFVYFNPMGMGIEDLAVATMVYRKALLEKRGTFLE